MMYTETAVDNKKFRAKYKLRPEIFLIKKKKQTQIPAFSFLFFSFCYFFCCKFRKIDLLYFEFHGHKILLL